MIDFDLDTKYHIDYTIKFKKQLKKILKQGYDVDQLLNVVTNLANLQELDYKYRNHKINNDKYYKDCYECHIDPNWLLIYKYVDDKLVLLLFATGSHSDLFKGNY